MSHYVGKMVNFYFFLVFSHIIVKTAVLLPFINEIVNDL